MTKRLHYLIASGVFFLVALTLFSLLWVSFSGAAPQNSEKSTAQIWAEVFDETNGAIQGIGIGRGVTTPQDSSDSVQQILAKSYDEANGALQFIWSSNSSDIPFTNFSGLADGDLLYYDTTGGEWLNSAGELTWDDANMRLGVNINTPNVQLHLNNDAGTNTRIQLTNTDTGTSTNDGTVFGISNTEVFEFVNFENTDIQFYTNGLLRGIIEAGGQFVWGHSDISPQRDAAVTWNPTISGADDSNGGIAMSQFSASYAPKLWLSRSRNGTIGSHTIVQDNDELGRLYFSGSDGTYFENAAAIIAEVDGTPGANDMPGALVFATTADGANTVTERMRISSGGVIVLGSAQAIKRTDAGAADYNPSALTTDYLITADNSAAARAITISTEDVASGTTAFPRTFLIKDEYGNATTNNLTVSLESGNIDGAASQTISTDYAAIMLYCTGTNCFIY